jgi:hypothetical protein
MSGASRDTCKSGNEPILKAVRSSTCLALLTLVVWNRCCDLTPAVDPVRNLGSCAGTLSAFLWAWIGLVRDWEPEFGDRPVCRVAVVSGVCGGLDRSDRVSTVQEEHFGEGVAPGVLTEPGGGGVGSWSDR